MKSRLVLVVAFLAFLVAALTAPGDAARSAASSARGQMASGMAVIPAGAVSSPGGIAHHAVCDFNADGYDDLLLDLGSDGMWLWDRGTWNRISTSNMEGMVLAEYDGDAGAEVFVDRGASGLWVYNHLNLGQLTASLPETMAAGDVDGDGMDEALADLWSTGAGSAPIGLWLYNAGWSRISSFNPDSEIAADVDGDATDEVIGDFGGLGLWKRDLDTWTQMTGVSPEFMTSGNHDIHAGADLVVDFGSLGVISGAAERAAGSSRAAPTPKTCLRGTSKGSPRTRSWAISAPSACGCGRRETGPSSAGRTPMT